MSETAIIEQFTTGSESTAKTAVTQGFENAPADLAKLVTAANNEKAAWKAYVQYLMRNRSENPVKALGQVFSNDIQQKTIADISGQLTEVDLTLADLEPKAKAGDKKAAEDIAYLSEMQTKLQEQLGQVTQVPQEVKKDPQSLLSRIVDYVDSKIYRLWLAINAPINEPLEALRSRALHEYQNILKASGRSSILGIRPTLWVMVGMRQSPQSLADQISDMRIVARSMHTDKAKFDTAV